MSQIDSVQHVMPLIKTLKNTTCFHDYFHETRMHQRDCIWQSRYGCFLQPFQVHLVWNRMNGEPEKNNVQSHEMFLILIYESMRIHRFDCFLTEQIVMVGSDPPGNLMAMDAIYMDYCDALFLCPDEPSRFCALFMKDTEAYLQCWHGCKKSDFYLMEQERCDWLGAHKLCGKANYVTETCRSMGTFYDPNLSNYDCEEMRNNQFNTLSTNGNAIAHTFGTNPVRIQQILKP